MRDPFSENFLLPPRRESFLAHYSRNLKMTVTVIALAIAILPAAAIHGYISQQAVKPLPQARSGEDALYMPSMPPVGSRIETDTRAPAMNDQDDRTVKLVPAPDSRVTADDAQGSLPRISEDGQRPWQLYARPFNSADKRPRIAIVVVGLGMSRTISDEAINQLPPTVTLTFRAESPTVGAWGQRARQDGHEILLEVPMEPFDFPHSDPGPNTLLTTLPNGDNLGRLLKVLRSATGYVGITSVLGSRFTADTNKLSPVLGVLHDRGLMVLDARAAPHSVVTDMAHTMDVPVATATQRLDSDLSPDAIAVALDNLERTARQSGRAVGVTTATPVMIAQLQVWMKGLPSRGIALAPLSAMVQ